MKVDRAIRIFSKFLDESWKIANELLINRHYTSDDDSLNDWLQANWELLIERKCLAVNEFLEVYGDGADFNGGSSRITDPEALPTHKIKVSFKKGGVFDILNSENVMLTDISFEKLVGFKDGFYVSEPKFHFALIIDHQNNLERVVSLEDLEFEMERLSTSGN